MVRRSNAKLDAVLATGIATVMWLATASACGGRTRAPTTPASTRSAQAPASTATNNPARSAAGAAQEAGARGSTSASEPGSARVHELEPLRIEVVGTSTEGEPELVAFDARSLLDQGNDALARGRPAEALVHYEKLLAVFPDSELVPAALYNSGLAHEARRDYDLALERYGKLAADRAPGRDARDSIDAQLRMGAVLAELERWTEARKALEAALGRNDLTHSDRIEAMARLGYVAIEQKDYARAETVLRDALAYYKKLTTRLDSNYFVAMCHYYLAQIPHRQFQAITMRLPDDQLKRDLEAKSELVALAYDRYVDVLDVLDVYWATAAGYQMSQIYKELWDDIVLAPVPTQLGPDAAEYYVREVHMQVRVLLEKAMQGHLKNVELAEAYKTSTVWSDASRERAAQVTEILARETSGELVQPDPAASEQRTRLPGAPGEYVPARVEL